MASDWLKRLVLFFRGVLFLGRRHRCPCCGWGVRGFVDEGSLITPPAGTVGRGDAFILEIADRAGAVVVSNDSFQEFHGDYQWLFDDGRLIGGKPVPHVGWVFVERVPVRGPVSRKATRGVKSSSSTSGSKSRGGSKSGARRASKAASAAQTR